MIELAPLVAAKATVLLGQIAATRGDTEVTRGHFRDAILTLSAAGSDRGVAELWFELGTLLEEHGMLERGDGGVPQCGSVHRIASSRHRRPGAIVGGAQ